MAVRVSPTEANPTHMVSLSDGTTTIGLNLCDGKGNLTPLGLRQSGVPRTSLQIRQGDPDYSSYELPYTTLTQKDWSGGRALEDFTKDGTRFYDGYRVDTRGGDVVLGPKETIGIGMTTKIDKAGTTPEVWDEADLLAVYYTPLVATSLKAISIYAFQLDNSYYVSLYSGASEPTTLLASSSGASTPIGDTADRYFYMEINYAMTAGVKYWFVFQSSVIGGSTSTVYRGADTSTAIWKKIGAGAWGSYKANETLNMIIHASGSGKVFFFDYTYGTWAINKGDDGFRPSLWRNGYRGLATPNSADYSKLNTTLDLSGASLAGKVVKIFAGPGSGESQNWRVITSNTTTGTNDVITVSPVWKIAHTTSTRFVVLGCDNWTQINSVGSTGTSSATTIKNLSTYLTSPVTDVLVADNIVYLAQGDAVNICRLNLTATEVWSDAAADGTNKADFLSFIPDTQGVKRIWRAIAQGATVARATAVAWPNNLTFETAKECGNTKSKITGMEPYGNPTIPYILKENGLGSINSGDGAGNYTYAPVNLREAESVSDTYNGRAHCQFGVYLFFSLGQGLERFYENRLDDIGPNLEEGFPTTRRGYITDLLPYPGGIFAAVDAGDSGYSCIMFWNQLGWHEIYRSATAGNRINSLHIQTIPGETADRLWYGEEQNIYFVPVSLNPRKQTGYTYTTVTPAPHIITAWISGGFKEITKFWKSVTLFTEGLSANVNITISYQTNNDADTTAWTALPTTFTTSPVQEVAIATLNNVSGKRIRFKITFNTNSTSATPRLKAMTIDSVTRLPVKRAWTITFRADDAMRDLATGESEALTAFGIIAQCATWADSATRATPVTFRNIWPTFDNNSVFIDPLSISPSSVQVNAGGKRHEVQICTMTMYEA